MPSKCYLTNNIMLNRYHVNGLIMWPLFCSLDLAFGHCGKASKKMGTDLLAAFQLTHDLLFVFGILVIDLTKWCNFHLGTRKNWLKWKQSWLAYFSILLCCFMECSSNNLLLSCAQFQDAAFKSNKGESKNKSEVSTQVICSFSFVDQIL